MKNQKIINLAPIVETWDGIGYPFITMGRRRGKLPRRAVIATAKRMIIGRTRVRKMTDTEIIKRLDRIIELLEAIKAQGEARKEPSFKQKFEVYVEELRCDMYGKPKDENKT